MKVVVDEPLLVVVGDEQGRGERVKDQIGDRLRVKVALRRHVEAASASATSVT